VLHQTGGSHEAAEALVSKNRGWYVEIAGDQQFLGRHPEGAPPPREEQEDPAVERSPGDPCGLPQALDRGQTLPQILTVEDVCRAFQQHADRHNQTDTANWYRTYLEDLCNHTDIKDRVQLRLLPAADLKPYHVTRWLDAHPGWKEGRGQGCAIRVVKRAFDWAADEGHLRPNPIKFVKREAIPSRGRVLTREERAEVLAVIDEEEFRSFVEAMQESGARLSEIARLSAADVKLDLGVCVLEKHKTVRLTGKPKTIYLTPRFIEIVTPLIEKYPEGPLFREPRKLRGGNRPFSKQSICSRFRRLREKLTMVTMSATYQWAGEMRRRLRRIKRSQANRSQPSQMCGIHSRGAEGAGLAVVMFRRLGRREVNRDVVPQQTNGARAVCSRQRWPLTRRIE
jgi:hypothetical protein